MPFCSECGTALTGSAEACSNCGTVGKKKSSDVRTAVIALSCVFGLAVVMYASANRPVPSSVPLLSGSGSDAAQTATVPVRTDESYAEASASSLCSARYPADFSMRAACARNADSGRSDFIDIWNRYLSNESMNIALQNCFDRYTGSGLTDFSMAGACARNQEDGLNEVSR